MEREITLRIGYLTRILQRAEEIEKDERITALEFDEQTNQVTLYLTDKERKP